MEETVKEKTPKKTKQRTRGSIGLVVLAFTAFISLGLPDGLLGVAWPSLRRDFGMPLDAMGILLASTTAGYLFSSFFSGAAVRRIGIGMLLSLSCASTAFAMVGFSLTNLWLMIPVFGVFSGLGAGAIDAGLNTYTAHNHSEGLMQWLHASFGIGITMGPLIMTAGLNAFNSWRFGYAVVGIIQFTLAGCFAVTAGMWEKTPQTNSEPHDSPQPATAEKEASLKETLGHPNTWISLALFFFYTGIELSLGHWAYTLMTESRGIAMEAAGFIAGSFWATFTLGRILAGIFTRRLGSRRVVNLSLQLALAGALLLWWNPAPWAGIIGIVITGFAIAPIFPGLVSGTEFRVGKKHITNVIGMQIGAAGFGGAILPSLAGILAKQFSLEIIPIFIILLIIAVFLLKKISQVLN